MTELFRVYIIKCISNDCTYVGKTKSQNKRYNPIKYLYNRYNIDNNIYNKLGKSIDEFSIKNHKYKIIKSELNEDDANKLINYLINELGDDCLNDEKNEKIFEKINDLLEKY